jgi:hypothetical protein
VREGAVLAQAAPPLPRFSGKLGDDLAAELYCRTLQTEISEITRRSNAVLPYPASQRLIEAEANIDVEWPHGGFESAPDTGIIETLGVARLPDG